MHRTHRSGFAGALVAAALLVAATAYAKKVAGVDFPTEISVGKHKLKLNGTALYEATFLKVDVFAAGLYLEKPTKNFKAVQRCDAPLRVRMHYLRSIGKKRYRDGWRDALVKRAGSELPKYRDRIDKLVNGFQDVAEHEEQVITYTPESGLEIKTRTGVIGKFKGSEFCTFIMRGFVNPKDTPNGIDKGLMGK